MHLGLVQAGRNLSEGLNDADWEIPLYRIELALLRR
jgi:hypothetical protein